MGSRAPTDQEAAKPQSSTMNFLSGHIFKWPEDAEVVAAERIRASSKTRLLGARFPARDAWYKRKCLSRVYFLSPLVILACLAMLKTKIIPAMGMHAYASTFQGASCTTAASNLTDMQLPCDCRKSSKVKTQCKKEYPCLQLSVTLETGKGHKLTTTLYEDMEALSIKYHDCAVLNRRCPKHDPADTVHSMYEHYGEEGTIFNCLYNPAEPSEVLLHLMALPNSFWAMLVFVSLLLAASVGGPVIAYLTCGCMYVCTRTPPADILAEVERRKAEGDPLTSPGEQQQTQQQQQQQQQMQPPQSPLIGSNGISPPSYQMAVNSLPRYQTLTPGVSAEIPGHRASFRLSSGEPPVAPVYQPPPVQSAPPGSTAPLLQQHGGGGGANGSTPLYPPPAEEGSQQQQQNLLAAPPVTILYVHPGNIVSTVPPPGVAPLSYQPSPCPSPGPPLARQPQVLLTKDGQQFSDTMFYQ